MEISLPGIKVNRIVPPRKLEYAEKLKKLLSQYQTCLIVTVDNVGSSQIAEMRKAFRSKARFLFGKNTLIRKVIRDYMKETGDTKLYSLLEILKGNCGFCFTDTDIASLRKDIISRKIQCAAKAGTIAPDDVTVPSGPTNMEPTQTGFFQIMNIPTRINKGQIDIIQDMKIIRAGDKVGASEAVLLTKLGIRPFYYGMKVKAIYDNGDAYDASVLDITEQDVANAFFDGLKYVASLSLSINYPTIVSVPHSVLNAYKKVLGLGLSLNTYSWEKLAEIKKVLENPQAFAQTAVVSTGAPAAPGKANNVKEDVPSDKPSSGPANDMFGNDGGGSD